MLISKMDLKNTELGGLVHAFDPSTGEAKEDRCLGVGGSRGNPVRACHYISTPPEEGFTDLKSSLYRGHANLTISILVYALKRYLFQPHFIIKPPEVNN